MSGDSGWSAVIHHPSELELQNWNWEENDGEHERELPSTVDMDAIKGGGSWDPSNGPNGPGSIDSEEDSDSDDDSSAGSEGSCSYSDSNSESDDDSSGEEEDGDTETNSDCTSERSEQTFSIQETNFEQSSECSSDDSDTSVSNAASSQHANLQQQQPLQEINQEDLAAILPDQEHEDAPFDGFEDSESGRLVSKAIERMSLGADSDTSENTEQNPVPVYSSTLLQQFVEKTALLSEPRKRRSKLSKKLNDPEYPCISNVSPDSGIQSVDNSPLHLAVSPVSPPVASQSPVQPAAAKPAVNVDRVLYPPKRKPGRPAKIVSTQPRGPGRPKLKPEVVEKIEKLEKHERQDSISEEKTSKDETSLEKKTKSNHSKAPTSQSRKENSSVGSKGVKDKKPCLKKKSSAAAKVIQEKTIKKTEKISPPVRPKSISKSTSASKAPMKETPQDDNRNSRKARQEKSCSSNNKNLSLSKRQKQSAGEETFNEPKPVSSSKKTLKENRNNSGTVTSKKQQHLVKKSLPSISRRVLKENKNGKKSISVCQTDESDVQALVSLPVTGNALKSENGIQEAKTQDKGTQPMNVHKHHHHKHRRRIVAPPKTPIRIDPSILQELDKLIESFSKSCSLGRSSANSNHSELPQMFRVKKPTKKRKGDVNSNDDQKLKRRLKKEKTHQSNGDSKNSTNSTTNSNPNEQRLPLKKRHYHVSSPHSSQSSNASGTDSNTNEGNCTDSHIEEAIEATITRYGESSNSSIKDTVPVTPKKRHRDAEESVCSGRQDSDSFEDKPLNQLEVQPRRKKKIIKDLRVTVTKLTADVLYSQEKADKLEKSSNEKNLKNAAEKSNKLEKVSSEISIKSDKTQLERIQKTEVPYETGRHEKRIKTDCEVRVSDSSKESEAIADCKVSKSEGSMSLPSSLDPNAVLILTKKKIRRRKTINRTGFPTLKKKKKKKLPSTVNETTETKKSVTIARVPKSRNTVSDVDEDNEDDREGAIDDKAALLLSRTESAIPVVDAMSAEDPVCNKTLCQVETANLAKNETSNITPSDDVSVEACPGQLRVRKDLVESDTSVASEKICPIKRETVQESKIFDENAPLEESLVRYNQNQRIAELNEENLKKLERVSSQTNIKMELLNCFNNSHKKRRGSASPCNLTSRNPKRLRSTGYDTESEILPSNDVAASDDHEPVKHSGSSHNRKKQARWKKRYLQTEIISEYGKDDERKKASTTDHSGGKNKLLCDSGENANEILSGKLLRQRKMPFQLPYDLWWLHAHSRLNGRDLVPSWNYKKIRTNIYYDVKPTTLYEAQACECKPESGCGDDCINRMVFSECSPQLCPCGEKCENQKIQKHEWSPGLQRFMTEDKGWGVRTQQAIKSGDFILEYVGEVVSEREFKSRMATRYANDTHHYCLHLDGGLVIDGHRMGGDGRFVNHSCEPNCEMQKWSVHGLPRMALFASRNIKPGEELTYDYNFALFNPSEGQECRCGSNACRGVIGGKSQRVSRTVASLPSQSENNERRSVGRPRKNRKSNTVQSSNSKGIVKTRKVGETSLIHTPQLKPMSHQQRSFAQQHHCFLLRNLEKVRRLKSLVNQVHIQNGKTKIGGIQAAKEKSLGDSKTQSDAFYSQLTALTNNNPRTVRTRRLAQAQDDPEVHKTAKLAKVLKELYTVVTTANDENHQLLCTSFMNLPTKRKLPEYYEKIIDPIDLSTIDQCIGTGHYKTAEQFDQDMIKLFDNNVRFFGRTSEVGIAAARLRKLYLGCKPDFVEAITEATGSPPSQGFLPPRGSTAGEEDVIRCICGLHRDEGLMIQCERCLVWQHCDCVKADTSAESYLCERCQPRPVDLEILLEGEEEEEGKKHYVTLLRGDLQLRQGDTVYVLRDTPEKHTYKTIQKPDYEQMDIFRIERLWKNNAGERFVFGHHYLRPHETYHEPTRKFYENEVVCAPLYEAVPCDLVAERCWVLDPRTYCKGRPVGSTPQHTYVCEYRVDRAARFFTKVARSRHQVCTKPYAFEIFPQRIKHYRTYLPHSLEGIQFNSKMPKDKKKNNNHDADTNIKTEANNSLRTNYKDQQHKSSTGRTRRRSGEMICLTTPATSYAQREEQKKKLDKILLNLLQKMPNKKDPLDLSFLLERNRRNRKRPGGLNP
ncbi:histone-lysine N-methyltransferase ash1 isoform X2 [Prorops nasuta]|uniref:histone-lysine N-methyltransferase ash1 isoform X2 n=1 Tax=Prorops nasuta TaxID=863751 RepID=UPI0034CEA382